MPDIKFQSTPLQEGRLVSLSLYSSFTCFNPRPYKRGDRSSVTYSTRYTLFQSTPLQEGRPYIYRVIDEGGEFQSTPLQEGRPRRGGWWCPCVCFNPRPYKRGDLLLECIMGKIKVSIHAPTRGATPCRGTCRRCP